MDKLAELTNADMEEILGTILSESGYRDNLVESDTEEDLNRLANIEELLTDARQFDEQNPGGGYLELYLENAWLVNETDDWQTDSEKVTLMTLHAAKGLEFPVVFLVAVEHGLLPHERSSSDESQLEEERRLAFVGVTRAEQELQLSYAVERDFRGQRRRTVPSSFLLEMPREEMQLTQVSAVDDHWDEVDWEEGDQDHEQFEDEFDVTAMDADVPDEPSSKKWQVAASQVTTAAQLAGATAESTSQTSPDEFAQGMAVSHPEHGLGKIVALSGAGKNRRATVRFATAGEKRFVLVHSPLRPAGR